MTSPVRSVAMLLAIAAMGAFDLTQPGVRAQQPAGVAALAQLPTVRRALDLARTTESQTLEDQVRFCETAAPPFQEGARADLVRREFTQLGLQNVRVDRAGNVLADRPGSAPRPHVVIASHLDTVFPPETNVKVTRAGTTLRGPGIGDNCRGLAVLVAVARVMRSAGLQTTGLVTFVANVGEEGLGDLRGMRELFGVAQRGASAPSDIDRFISIDGPGLFVINGSVGSRRYRVTFNGPGGHSYSAFGTPSPIGALGRAVAKINEIQVPAQPRTTYNVGRIGGGASVNAIPSQAWMEIDLRSAEPASLVALDGRVLSLIQSAVVEENARWGRPGVVTVSIDLVGDRPGGNISAASPMVQTAQSAARALGFTAPLSEASTDANLPLSLGIPAVTVGGGGNGTDAHAPSESFDSTDAWKGTQHVLLLLLALAQP